MISSKLLFVCIVLILAVFITPLFSQSPSQLYQQGLLKENGEGDLKAAVTIYQKIVAHVKKPSQKARMSRPPLPADQTRCKRVVTFVTLPEMKRLEELASGNNDTLSSMCHRIISEHLENYLARPLT